ncbi:glycosyltransferase family 2 protein [Seleniivibrio woodruffii]|uniref:glycosyltransferase family 2 protein n=1 Tax=Seleniivibrio woodruffii TaxID=1078050 RepID=UPI0026EA0175|nr:glycosyltransferase family 2 protein [Seleniivibrio woodruffii]
METRFSDKLTIAIPCYERYDYFEEAVNSAINQTVRCSVIVVDNGSSHNKFRDYIERLNDNRIKYYRNEKNIGMFGNWNKCYLYSETEYVMILGDDDILNQGFVEEFEKAVSQYDIDIYFSDFVFLYEKTQVRHPYKLIFGSSDIGKIKKKACFEGLSFPTISQCTRRKIMVTHPFMENPHGSNDWLHIYTLDDDLKVYGNDKVLMTYRRHLLNDSSINAITTGATLPVIYWQLYKYYEKDDNVAAQSAKRNAIKRLLINIIKGNFRFREYLMQQNYYADYYRNVIFPQHRYLRFMAYSKAIMCSSKLAYALIKMLK